MQHNLCIHSLYAWRRRLAKRPPTSFAVVEFKPDPHSMRAWNGLLSPAAILLISSGVDAATLRTVNRGAAGARVIHLPASVRVYLCTSPCDMRRSFDGLHALVSDMLQLDAFAGHLFVFANRRRDRVKILYWDRDGFAVWAKRLEEGAYAMPFSEVG